MSVPLCPWDDSGSDSEEDDWLFSSLTRYNQLLMFHLNPLQGRMIDQAAVHAGHSLSVRFNDKMTKHGEARREGMVFIPLVVETLGGWEEQADVQIKRLGAALARQTGQEESDKIRHVFQSLAVRLAKGNAALFLNRTPSFPNPEVDGQE